MPSHTYGELTTDNTRTVLECVNRLLQVDVHQIHSGTVCLWFLVRLMTHNTQTFAGVLCFVFKREPGISWA